jgi:hypothetical protein
MITAEDAHGIVEKCSTWNIVDRQILFVNGWIRSTANLGRSKFNWVVPDEFTKKEISYIITSLRQRGFEVVRNEGVQIYTILW